MIALYVDEKQKTWDLFIPYMVYAINSARQESTRFSPYYLLYGRDAKFPIDLAFNTVTNFKEIEDFETRFDESRAMARIYVAEARRKQKLAYDTKHKDYEFTIGQNVLIFTKKRIVGLAEKLLCNWFGPYVILKRIGKVTYDCKDLETGFMERTHVSRMKPYYLDDIDDESIWSPISLDLHTFSDEFASRPGANETELGEERNPTKIDGEFLLASEE